MFDADKRSLTADGCHGGWGGFNRVLCVESSVYAPLNTCKWYGTAGACKQGCPAGYTLLSQNSHVGSKSCNSGAFKSFCCEKLYTRTLDYCPNTNLRNTLSGGLAPRVAAVSKFTKDDYGTALECAMAIVGDQNLHRAIGAIAGIYILNTLPGSWRFYAALNNYVWVPIRNIAYVAAGFSSCTTTVTSFAPTTVVTSSPKKVTCDGAAYPQPCRHYSSVAKQPGNDIITCGVVKDDRRSAPTLWDSQHADAWRYWVPKLPRALWLKMKQDPKEDGDKCQRDEYPPAAFQGPRGGPNAYQYIRFVPGSHNQGAGQLWKNICPDKAKSEVSPGQGGLAFSGTCTELLHVTYTRNAMSMDFKNIPINDDGLDSNPCLPIVTDDPGFALLNNDPWYGGTIGRRKSPLRYKQNPLPAQTNGLTQPRVAPYLPAKRHLGQPLVGHPDDIIVEEGNSTRHATDEELFQHYGIRKCASDGCKKEQEELGDILEPIDESVRQTPAPTLSPTATQVMSTMKTAVPLLKVDSDPAAFERPGRSPQAMRVEVKRP